jgi:hypothetical protein
MKGKSHLGSTRAKLRMLLGPWTAVEILSHPMEEFIPNAWNDLFLGKERVSSPKPAAGVIAPSLVMSIVTFVQGAWIQAPENLETNS